jgi:hypothetical protein
LFREYLFVGQILGNNIPVLAFALYESFRNVINNAIASSDDRISDQGGLGEDFSTALAR